MRPRYLDDVMARLGVGVLHADHAADPEAVRPAINRWVGERTGGLIDELLGRGSLTADSMLTLVNAVHLTAPWRSPFRQEQSPSEFGTAGGRTVPVPLHRTTAWFTGGSGDGWQSVTVPYRGGGLVMTVVLPDHGAFDAVRVGLPAVVAAAQAADRAGSGGWWTCHRRDSRSTPGSSCVIGSGRTASPTCSIRRGRAVRHRRRAG